MRKQIVTVVAAATLGLSGIAVAVPALAATAAPAVSSQVDRLKDALAGLVTDGTLTQAQADKVATTLDAAGVGSRGPGGHGGPGGRGRDLSTAATALGVTENELRAALEGGKTLAQVAEAEGVDVDTLVAALTKAEKERIAQAVTDGRLTQAQADARLAELTARVTERVNSTRPVRSRGERPEADNSTDAPVETPSAAATT
jgi:hypothetical protein